VISANYLLKGLIPYKFHNEGKNVQMCLYGGVGGGSAVQCRYTSHKQLANFNMTYNEAMPYSITPKSAVK